MRVRGLVCERKRFKSRYIITVMLQNDMLPNESLKILITIMLGKDLLPNKSLKVRHNYHAEIRFVT